MFITELFIIAQTSNQPKCPSVIVRIEKMWYIHTVEYYAAMKRNEIISFSGTWMKLEVIILSQLTEQKTKYCMFSFVSGSWTLRTHGHWEGNNTYQGLLWVRGEEWGEVTWRRVNRCSKPPWHMYTYVTDLQILHMYPVFLFLRRNKEKKYIFLKFYWVIIEYNNKHIHKIHIAWFN